LGEISFGRRRAYSFDRNRTALKFNQPRGDLWEMKTVEDLLAGEIKDLYSAEKQLTKAIPKMAKGSNDETLRAAFNAHLGETRAQVDRLEKIAAILGIRASGKKCVGMEGCIQEGAEALTENGGDGLLDLGLIGAGACVEHYEIAAYITAISLAQRVRRDDVVDLLKASLAEEQAADKKLRTIAAGLLKRAPVAQTAKGRA
jgi:ferritin-like metal-binding protein YciE